MSGRNTTIRTIFKWSLFAIQLIISFAMYGCDDSKTASTTDKSRFLSYYNDVMHVAIRESCELNIQFDESLFKYSSKDKKPQLIEKIEKCSGRLNENQYKIQELSIPSLNDKQAAWCIRQGTIFLLSYIEAKKDVIKLVARNIDGPSRSKVKKLKEKHEGLNYLLGFSIGMYEYGGASLGLSDQEMAGIASEKKKYIKVQTGMDIARTFADPEKAKELERRIKEMTDN